MNSQIANRLTNTSANLSKVQSSFTKSSTMTAKGLDNQSVSHANLRRRTKTINHQYDFTEIPRSNVSNINLNSSSNKKRWIANVSQSVRISKGTERAINIKHSDKFSQYELIVQLLKAENCDVIYFDCQLSSSQIGIIKMLQMFSNTELVHARLAMQFSREAC
ncbi:hypothetical protein PN836_003410 [Ningiella sp. W23]|uniref:hypothetical protein n=1 Tax=Ningiella sp. W23 TaxID=3023715 RepID=UPI00375761CA